MTRFEKIKSDIARYGWSGIFVFDSDADRPPFLYTIGLTEIDLPEILVVGLPPDIAHGMVISAIKDMLDEGYVPKDGTVTEKVLTGYKVRYRDLDANLARTHYACQAFFYYENFAGPRTPSVIQLVWPDEQGRFPGETDCAGWVADAQTLETPLPDPVRALPH